MSIFFLYFYDIFLLMVLEGYHGFYGLFFIVKRYENGELNTEVGMRNPENGGIRLFTKPPTFNIE